MSGCCSGENRVRVEVEYLDAEGGLVLSQTEEVEVTDGGWIFLNRRLF